MNRRKFIIKSLLATAGLSLFYSWQIEPFWLEFVHQDLPIKNLPSKLHNKVLMQISDLHVGNRFDWNYLIDSFKSRSLQTGHCSLHRRFCLLGK